MSEKRKILIIENQYYQFLKIYENLADFGGYIIYPEKMDEATFIGFIDYVRVWVNKQYIFVDNGNDESKHRTPAFNYIYNFLEANHIELIMMDYILGGAHHCLTGIDLAWEINNKRVSEKKEIIPVVFLSKSTYEEEKRERGKKGEMIGINEYEEIYKNSSLWAHKGYFGKEILDPDYFNTIVIDKINKCIGESEEEIFFKTLDKIIHLDYGNNINQLQGKLMTLMEQRKYSDWNDSDKELIFHISKSTWELFRIQDLKILDTLTKK